MPSPGVTSGVASPSSFCFFLAAASRAAVVMSSPKTRKLSALDRSARDKCKVLRDARRGLPLQDARKKTRPGGSPRCDNGYGSTYLLARLSSMSMTDTLDFQMGSTSSCASLPSEYRV